MTPDEFATGMRMAGHAAAAAAASGRVVELLAVINGLMLVLISRHNDRGGKGGKNLRD